MTLVGQQLGHYRLVRLIGQGGMGEVYLAEDTRMSSHQVAIKVIVIPNDCQAYPDNSAWRQAEKSFQHEIQAIIQLDHPNILSFKDYGEQSVANESIMYMVMPYRAEGSLVNWLMQRGPAPLAPQDVGQMIMQAASALQHAHDRSIIHRDVKPANFLVRTNADHPMYPDLLLADFGIAKIMLATATTTRSMGTVAYMAPEQWNGDVVPASDQYALAVMTYQLLTGQLPFQGSQQQVMHQHFTISPKPPSKINTSLSSAVDDVILRALAKQADERFPTVKDFAVALQQALVLEEISSTLTVPDPKPFPYPVPPMPPLLDPKPSPNSKWTWYWTWRRPVSLLGLLVAIALLLTVSGVSAFRYYTVVTNNAHATATAIADTHATATAQSINDGNATATAQSVNDDNATATAQAQATATALYSYRSLGTQAFTDPLSDSNSSRWSEESNPNSGGQCQFVNGAYQNSQPSEGRGICNDENDPPYSNFVFEVNMTINQGDCGGMAIRNDESTGKVYIFEVCSGGGYQFMKYASSNGSDSSQLQHHNSSSAINQGNQSNCIAVVANGGEFDLYVNGQQIDSVIDYGYSQGKVGLIAWDNGDATTVTFQNATLWML